MLRGCAGFAMLASACYNPRAIDACAATCDFASLGSAAPCPSGLTCAASGVCTHADGACGPPADAAVDAPPCPRGATRVGHDFPLCLPTTIPSLIGLPATVDTNGVSCDASDSDHCLISAGEIEVTGTVRVKGSRPLVLAAASSIIISSTLDAASRAVTATGPNANWSGCNLNGVGGSGSGGGAGGSFHGIGGGGGGPSAGAAALSIPDAFHGGCQGGKSQLFPGGAGGGAVYLVAGSLIEVTGVVDADGAPGLGGLQGTTPAGGEGGGSGGYIGLDAPMIMVGPGAVVVATGGGGGGGAGNSAGRAGDVPGPTNGWLSAGGTGGGTAPVGGDGGDGAFLTSAGQPGQPGTGGGGGGGGGGGAGYIHIWSGASKMIDTNATVAPTP